jgi:hypothetical protein
VRVVRGGKRLARLRHHLGEAGLEEAVWRERWRAARMFLAADGESGKRFGNETIRITDTGQVSLKLPAPLAHLANAPHGRYVLDATVQFKHRGDEWLDRISTNRAVAYRIHHECGARPLVCDRVLAASRCPGAAAGGGHGAGCGGGGHERRTPRRLAVGQVWQPGG